VVGRASGWGWAFLSCFLALPAHETWSAAFQVDSEADAVDVLPGDGLCATSAGECTLRAAIQETNALAGPDDISLPAGTYMFTIAGEGEDESATGDLDVLGALRIRGEGPVSTVVDAAQLDRVIHVLESGSLELGDLTLAGGRLFGSGAGLACLGRSAVLRNVVVRDCEALASAGAVWISGATASLTDCEIRDNTASTCAGLDADGSILLIRTTISGNEALDGDGGGACLRGDAELIECSISGNTVQSGGRGGGLLVQRGSVLLRACLLGGFNRFGGAAYVSAEASLTAVDTTFNGWADPDGGALMLQGGSAWLTACTLVGTATTGGAVFVAGAGVLEAVNCTLRGSAERGGSLAVHDSSVLLKSCTLDGASTLGSADALLVEGASRVEVGHSVLHGPFEACVGEIVSLGYNFISANSSCIVSGDSTGNISGPSPALTPLAANGGPTDTTLPDQGSSLIDAGNPAGCTDTVGAPLTTDQRGFPRVADGDGDGTAVCDIGAVEVCGADSDLDGRGDACDCATSDPEAFARPGQALLEVTRIGPSEVRLAWNDLAAGSGSGTLYDVASDLLSSLWASRVVDTPCLARDLTATTALDDRVVEDDGFYFLVRGTNACVSAGEGWGSDSLARVRAACP